MTFLQAEHLLDAGRALLKMGDPGGARRLCEQALKIDPTLEGARQLLATISAAVVPKSMADQPITVEGAFDAVSTRGSTPGHGSAPAARPSASNEAESQLGPLSAVPKLRMTPKQVIGLKLDHRAGFLLAQVDGIVSYEDLFALSGMPRGDTASALRQLIELGAIAPI